MRPSQHTVGDTIAPQVLMNLQRYIDRYRDMQLDISSLEDTWNIEEKAMTILKPSVATLYQKCTSWFQFLSSISETKMTTHMSYTSVRVKGILGNASAQ